MNARLAFITLAIVILAVVFLPGVVRRIDSAANPILADQALLAALYNEMTNLTPIASEMSFDHPAARRWRECRAKLFEAGYLETRELPMKDRLMAKGATRHFYRAFQTRFPGIECGIRAAGTDQSSATITAPKSSFGMRGDIERFIRQYRYEPKDDEKP